MANEQPSDDVSKSGLEKEHGIVGNEGKLKSDFTITEQGEKIYHDMDHVVVERYIEERGLDPDQVRRWIVKADELLRRYGTNFELFVEKYGELVRRGDDLLTKIETTGFNVDRFDIFPDEEQGGASRDIVIYYNNQIDRPEHFGLLLAKMKKDGCLDGVDVELNCKATRVIWKWDDTSETIPTRVIVRSDGSKRAVGESIEVVVKFSINVEEVGKVVDILKFFKKNTFLFVDGHIPGSWEIPDIRVQPDLFEYDAGETINPVSPGYISVVSNVYEMGDGKLMVLREKKKFDDHLGKEGWRSSSMTVNEELARFITADGVSE